MKDTLKAAQKLLKSAENATAAGDVKTIRAGVAALSHAALEATSKYKKALTEAELAAVTAGLKDEMVYERDGIFAYLYCEKCGM